MEWGRLVGAVKALPIIDRHLGAWAIAGVIANECSQRYNGGRDTCKWLTNTLDDERSVPKTVGELEQIQIRQA
jgi:hypothetical protein